MDPQVAEIVQRGLDLFRKGELLAALSEWEHALELDPACEPAAEYKVYVESNFDLLSERYKLDAKAESLDVDGSFGLEAIGPESGVISGEIASAADLPRSRPDDDFPAGPSDSNGGWALFESPAAAIAAQARALARRAPGSPKPARAATSKPDPADLATVLPPPEQDDLLQLDDDEPELEISIEGDPLTGEMPFEIALPDASDDEATREHRPGSFGPGLTWPPLDDPSRKAEQEPPAPSPELSPPHETGLTSSETVTMRSLPLQAGKEPVTDQERSPKLPENQPAERDPISHRRVSVEPFNDRLTPLPGLPGEGPVSVGSDPALDDAWTLNREQQPSSWPKPQPTSGQSPDEIPTIQLSKVDPTVAPLIIEELPPSDHPGRYRRDADGNDLRDAVPEVEDDADTGKHHAARSPAAGQPEPEVQVSLDDFDSITPEPGKLPTGMVDPFKARGATEPPVPGVGENPMGVRLDANAGGAAAEALLEELAREDDDDDELSFIEMSPLDKLAQDLLANLDQGAPPDEPRRARLKRRITALIERAKAEHKADNLDAAVMALDLAIDEDPDSAITQKLIHLHSDDICDIYQSYIGDLNAVPVLAVDMGDLARANIDSRAAFLISRLDGLMSVDELLDIAGMPRLEAYRHLCVLRLKGLIQFE